MDQVCHRPTACALAWPETAKATIGAIRKRRFGRPPSGRAVKCIPCRYDPERIAIIHGTHSKHFGEGRACRGTRSAQENEERACSGETWPPKARFPGKTGSCAAVPMDIDAWVQRADGRKRKSIHRSRRPETGSGAPSSGDRTGSVASRASEMLEICEQMSLSPDLSFEIRDQVARMRAIALSLISVRS